MALDKLLKMIEKRPNMAFREKTLIYLKTFLDGYFFCRIDDGNIQAYEEDFRYYFSMFIEEKFEEEQAIGSWDVYLMKKDDSWNLFFELYNEFRSGTWIPPLAQV